jgi:NDP-sugar pyrophosphorylase family protein
MLPVAILAGGRATRLGRIADDVPKILIDINGRPFAHYQIEQLRQANITRVVYCVGYLGEQVAAALGNGSRWQMDFEYVHDGPRPLGTGGALRAALPLLGPVFFVMYGDSYLTCDVGAVQRAFKASGRSGLMTVFRNEGRWDASNVVFNDGRIIRYDKTSKDSAMRHIDYGLGVLKADALDPTRGLPDAGKPFDLALVYQRLIAQDDLAGFEVTERFYEIGSAEGLDETRSFLARKGTSAV